ncbi:MAG: OmpA family protein [Flavobacteriales bacterium]
MKNLLVSLLSIFAMTMAIAQQTNIDELTEGRSDIILKIKKQRLGGKYIARINIDKGLDAAGERYYNDNRLKETESRNIVYFDSMDDLNTFFSKHGYTLNPNKFAYWDHPTGDKNSFELRNGTAKIGEGKMVEATSTDLKEVFVYSKGNGVYSSNSTMNTQCSDACNCPEGKCDGSCGCSGCGTGEKPFASVYFDTDKTDIRSGEMTDLVNALKADKNLNIRIEGNADKRGAKDYNQNLADRRAQKCLDTLVKKYGFSPKRFKLVSNGEVKPQSDDLSKNRRVDFFKN